jgi:hypothetical protein
MTWVKPAASNRLATSKEVNTFFTVRFGIAKERLLPATI